MTDNISDTEDPQFWLKNEIITPSSTSKKLYKNNLSHSGRLPTELPVDF